MTTHGYTYQTTLAAAERIHWRVEDLIGGDKRLDFVQLVSFPAHLEAILNDGKEFKRARQSRAAAHKAFTSLSRPVIGYVFYHEQDTETAVCGGGPAQPTLSAPDPATDGRAK